ncbi:sel1 repeat family protein [Rhodobacteraceae bacterium CCMM004]|nr:sel1 repeat family protein [Rhodobacteraceae bacterium CCMM004]
MARGSNAARRAWRRPGLALLIGALVGLGGPAAAQTVDLEFRPPDIAPAPVCVDAPRAEDVTAAWEAWDGETLPDRPSRDIRRDLARLRALDPVHWFDTIWRAIDLLQATDPALEPDAVLVLRIGALDAAGRLQELTEGGYVDALAAQIDTLKVSSKLMLSHYVRNGIGRPADAGLADTLLVDAGYAGEVKALMELAERQLAGTAPVAWAIPVEMTVATAFSTMLGDLDAGICDRAEDIATAYRLGRLVTPNPQLAHDWYRFGADLGDARAAWRVVEYQMTAEGMAKDNAVLVAYLDQAAAAGLPYAQIELAKTVERGALIPRDLDRALAIFDAVVASGDARGPVQRAMFLRRQADARPDLREALHAAMRTLAEGTHPPAWVLRDLAHAELADRGYWAGRAAAEPLFAAAAEMGDLDAQVNAARLSLAEAPTLADVDAAIDVFDRVFHVNGGALPVKEIVAAAVCRAPGAVDRDLARYWMDRFEAVNGMPAEEVPPSILDLRPERHPQRLASIQSEALHGTPTGLAEWRRVVADAPFVDAATRAFWAEAEGDDDAVFAAQVAVDLDLAQGRNAREAILSRLRARHLARGGAFAQHLDRHLFEAAYGAGVLADLSAAARADALSALEASAALGYGRAIAALADREALPEARRAIYERYRAAIDARGDHAAQVFAATFAAVPGPYVARAAGTMPCTFRNVMEMIALADRLGERDAVGRWLDAADVLADDRASRLKQMAHVLLRVEGDGALPRAIAYFERASALGDADAAGDLFRMVLRSGTAGYDPERAVALVAEAVAAARADLIAGYLPTVAAADPAVRALFDARIDMPEASRLAAESGDPASMRLHALALRARAADGAALADAMAWLRRAAEAGDVNAMTDLGQAYAFGIGVAADRAQALIWLERAADRGSSKAEEITHLVQLSGGQ